MRASRIALLVVVALVVGLPLAPRAQEEEGAGSYRSASEEIASSEACREAWESGDGLYFSSRIEVEEVPGGEESSGRKSATANAGSSRKSKITIYVRRLVTTTEGSQSGGDLLLTLTINGTTSNAKRVTARAIYRGIGLLQRRTVGLLGVDTGTANIRGSFHFGASDDVLVLAQPGDDEPPRRSSTPGTTASAAVRPGAVGSCDGENACLSALLGREDAPTAVRGAWESGDGFGYYTEEGSVIMVLYNPQTNAELARIEVLNADPLLIYAQLVGDAQTTTSNQIGTSYSNSAGSGSDGGTPAGDEATPSANAFAGHGTDTTIFAPGNVHVGDHALFTAIVAKQDSTAPGSPTGTVDFMLNASVGTVPLTGGSAGLIVVPTATGSITVGAAYDGGPSSTDATFDYDASIAFPVTKSVGYSLYVALTPEGVAGGPQSLARLQVHPVTKALTLAQTATTATEGGYNIADVGLAIATGGAIFLAGNSNNTLAGYQANLAVPFETSVDLGEAVSEITAHPTLRRLYVTRNNAGALDPTRVEYIDFDETANTAAAGIGSLVSAGSRALADTALRGTAVNRAATLFAAVHMFGTFEGVRVYALDAAGNIGAATGSAAITGVRPAQSFFDASGSVLYVFTLDDGIYSFAVSAGGALAAVDHEPLVNFNLDVAFDAATSTFYSLDWNGSVSELRVITADGAGNMSIANAVVVGDFSNQNLTLLGDGSTLYLTSRNPAPAGSHVRAFSTATLTEIPGSPFAVQDAANLLAITSSLVSSR